MRTFRRNTQKMYYSKFNSSSEPIYRYDDLGNKVISYVDPVSGDIEYEILEEGSPKYNLPVEFFGNISFSKSGEAETSEFGLNLSDYSAVLIVGKNAIQLDEKSLIWHNTEPVIVAGEVDPESADYSIVKVAPSLNYDKYVLKRLIKNEI